MHPKLCIFTIYIRQFPAVNCHIWWLKHAFYTKIRLLVRLDKRGKCFTCLSVITTHLRRSDGSYVEHCHESSLVFFSGDYRMHWGCKNLGIIVIWRPTSNELICPKWQSADLRDHCSFYRLWSVDASAVVDLRGKQSMCWASVLGQLMLLLWLIWEVSSQCVEHRSLVMLLLWLIWEVSSQCVEHRSLVMLLLWLIWEVSSQCVEHRSLVMLLLWLIWEVSSQCVEHRSLVMLLLRLIWEVSSQCVEHRSLVIQRFKIIYLLMGPWDPRTIP